MKIGIYGGTFDPIHLGHIAIAKAVKKELGLDKLFFVVAADPPHKPDPNRTSAALRLEMAEKTLAKKEGLFASDIEIVRGGKSYTCDTLAEFSRIYPGAELFFIVGADMLANFPTWYHPERILELAALTAVQRTGQAEDLGALSGAIIDRFGGKVIVSSACGPEISSTEVRRRIRDAEPIGDLVPYDTEIFIYENLLYAPEELVSIRDKLAQSLEPGRVRHSLLTVREAIRLAEKHGVDTQKARLCALVHDCAKVRKDLLAEYFGKYGFVPTAEETENPYMIHARLGAVVAKAEYGIDDEEILRAIELHTLGSPDMTALDKIIFLADKLEPSRNYRKIASIRKLAFTDLDAAVAAVIRNNIAYTRSCGKPIHPSTITTLAALEGRGGINENTTD